MVMSLSDITIFLCQSMIRPGSEKKEVAFYLIGNAQGKTRKETRMKFYPSLEEVRKIGKDIQYKVVPITTEILSDICTPIEAMKKLKNVSTHCYMLE